MMHSYLVCLVCVVLIVMLWAAVLLLWHQSRTTGLSIANTCHLSLTQTFKECNNPQYFYHTHQAVPPENDVMLTYFSGIGKINSHS